MGERVAAVVPAAGRGLRMGQGVPKQFLTLGGVPLLIHSLRILESADVVAKIILVVPEADRDHCLTELLPPFGFKKVAQVVKGGPRRQDSVRCGLDALSSRTDFVLVHDAVRPFISVDMVNHSVAAARIHGASIVAVPMRDTIKRVTSEGLVEATVDREKLWLAQTPQVFRWSLLKEAHQIAERDQVEATDDACLVERIDHPIAVVNGSYENMKITKPEDLRMGETILAARAMAIR